MEDVADPDLIAKEQIEYLLSISFTWTDIAALLGISRMTLYRYSDDYQWHVYYMYYVCMFYVHLEDG